MTVRHRDLDPRAKLAFAVIVAGIAVFVPDLVSLVGLLAVLTLTVAAGRGLGLREWLGFLRPLKLLIPILFVLNAFFYGGGDVVWAVPELPLALTVGGLRESAVIVTRLVVVAGVASWFASTTRAEEFEIALVRLGVPWSFAFVLSLSVRLVPEMRDRFRRVEEAQRSRGLTIEGGPIKRARARFPMIVPFLVSVVEYGYELSEALEVRSFGRERERTTIVELEYTRADYLFYVFSLVVLVAFVTAFVL